MSSPKALGEGHAAALGGLAGGCRRQPLAAPDPEVVGGARVDVADVTVGQPRAKVVVASRHHRDILHIATRLGYELASRGLSA